AKEIIGGMTRGIEIGQTYHGRVGSIKEFGAFVEVFSGKDGLVHIFRLADFRGRRGGEGAKIGEMIWGKCIGIVDKSRVKLSRKAALKERGEVETGVPMPDDIETEGGGEDHRPNDGGHRRERGERRGGRGRGGRGDRGRDRERRFEEPRSVSEHATAEPED